LRTLRSETDVVASEAGNHSELGPSLGHQAKGLTYVRGLAADFQVALHSDPQGQRFACRRVVIDEEDAASHTILVLAHGSSFQ
jgi:hypothetical protein